MVLRAWCLLRHATSDPFHREGLLVGVTKVVASMSAKMQDPF